MSEVLDACMEKFFTTFWAALLNVDFRAKILQLSIASLEFGCPTKITAVLH